MNPLINMMGGQPTNNTIANLPQLKRMMSMLSNAQNPQAAVDMLAKENPMIANIMSISKGDLKGTFYRMCQERGINPNDILSQLQN